MLNLSRLVNPRLFFVQKRCFGGGYDFDSFKKHYVKDGVAHFKNANFYKLVSILTVIPLLGSLYMGIQKEKEAHDDLPKYKANYKEYPYLNIRKRDFSWGD